MKTYQSCLWVFTLLMMWACHGNDSPQTPPPEVQVRISPGSAEVIPKNAIQFVATVSNAITRKVTWTVQEPEGGEISESGLYTAPKKKGVFHVIATSKDDPKKSNTVVVTVRSVMPIEVYLDFTELSLAVGDHQQFTAFTMDDVDNLGVDWSVVESTGGSVDETGLYTAPMTPGVYHLKASSKADPTRAATALITVYAATTPRPSLVLQGGSQDETLWRIESIPEILYGSERYTPNQGEIFIKLHIPKDLSGRGFAIVFHIDDQYLELSPEYTLLNLATGNLESYFEFKSPRNGKFQFAWAYFGSGQIPWSVDNTTQLMDETPLGDASVTFALRLKKGVTVQAAQTLVFNIAKAGLLSKNGVSVLSNAIDSSVQLKVVMP